MSMTTAARFTSSKAVKDIAVILGKSQRTERNTGVTFLINDGIPMTIDKGHSVEYNKVMVINSGVVITGNSNFTKSAQVRNAENLLVIRSPELANIYRANWR